MVPWPSWSYLYFSIDLLGAGVSLIVLFSDSLYALLGMTKFGQGLVLKY